MGDQPEPYTEILRLLGGIAARLRKHGIKVTASAAYDLPVDEAIVLRASLGVRLMAMTASVA